MNCFHKSDHIKLWFCLSLFLLTGLSSQGQESCKISSKAMCEATVTVTFYRSNAIPNYDDVVVVVPSVSVGIANAPSSDPNWVVCSIYVDFGGGSFIEDYRNVGGGNCTGQLDQAGQGTCFTNGGSGWNGTDYYFSWY